MLVPLQWLSDYVDLDLSVDEIAYRLTLAGLNVESITRLAAGWHDVVVGEIIEAQPHPSSRNPLLVTKVSTGSQVFTIVTGAPNVKVGDRVPVVPVGGTLPHGPGGEPIVIAARPMAGITSMGMLASAFELGLSDDHSGIYVLPPDAPVGSALEAVMGDVVLDLETQPNRPDTLSIVGVAREVAALTNQQLSLPDVDAVAEPIEWLDEDSFPVQVLDADLCPRYTALRIEDIRLCPSPGWLTSRLEAAGMRPISLLVDLTNYVMLELGQPMHAFDATALRGGKIVVRRAHPDEVLRTLDGVERRLGPENLVIADGEGSVAIAGVMGGENSEIRGDTTSLVLESATFDHISVRRTARTLGLRTQSSARFEKGLPAETAPLGARRFVQLLAQITGGGFRVARMTDVWVGPQAERTVRMPLRDLHRLVGMPIGTQTAADKLSLLGFGVSIHDSAIDVAVPYWRRMDVERSADVVEEVARMVGYDVVPVTLPRRTMSPPEPLPELHWQSVIRDRLLAAGVNEAVTGSLSYRQGMARLFQMGREPSDLDSSDTWSAIVPNPEGIRERGAQVAPLQLRNPPTQERDVPRLTLLPGLLDAVARNLKHTAERVAFFELAVCYFSRGPEQLPYERHTLSLAASGRRRPRSWQEPAPGPFTFYDAKGMVAGVLEALGIREWTCRPVAHPALHPGRSAQVSLRGRAVGFLGELHPRVADRFEIEGWPAIVAELDLDTVLAAASADRPFQPLPRYPAAFRDLAVVVGSDTPAEDVMRIARGAGGSEVESARIFDVYAGPPLPDDRKSVAIELELRRPEATLTQDEINAVIGRIVSSLNGELGATIRE